MSLKLCHFDRTRRDNVHFLATTKKRSKTQCNLDQSIWIQWQHTINIFTKHHKIICSNLWTSLLPDYFYTGVKQAKTKSGAAESPSSHLHPRFGTTAIAKTTSKQAPRAQKQSNNTTHLPLCFVGRNSA